jgi:Skp family chaperone for outer membrane proteins
MKLKFVCSLMAVAVLIASAASAQTSSPSSAALPAAPGTANDPPAVATSTGSKVAAINVEQAIFASNEGQRDMDTLSKKFEPKSNELKAQNDELEALKKKLSTATDDAKPELQRQVEAKQKSLDRAAQDAREDFQTQQNEIGQRILQKMAPIIMKYANENSLGLILDTSQPWPQGLVLWAGPSVDITKPVVDAYNAQSGIAPPAPRSGSSTRPGLGGTSKPAGSGTKPAAPSATKPAITTPPAK